MIDAVNLMIDINEKFNQLNDCWDTLKERNEDCELNTTYPFDISFEELLHTRINQWYKDFILVINTNDKYKHLVKEEIKKPIFFFESHVLEV